MGIQRYNLPDITVTDFGGKKLLKVKMGRNSEGEYVLYTDHQEALRKMMRALENLIVGISVCHYCGVDLIPGSGAARCEDCPHGCESHDAPDCVPLSVLIDAARAALKGSENV